MKEQRLQILRKVANGEIPYPEQQRFINMNNIVFEYMNGRYTLDDVYNQIKNKTCPLSRNVREYVLSHYNDEGDFIVGGE